MAHQHNTTNQSVRRIRLAFFLNFFFFIIEIFGGIAVNSMAIISDAVHDLGDTLSLGLAWYLEKKSKQKPTKQFTYGYGRFSLLGALINSLILIVGSAFVLNAAIQRIQDPEPSDALGMIWLAILGILINGFAAWRTSEGNNLNQRLVSWHLLEDVLGWFAVLIGAFIMLLTDNEYIDPILSILFSLFILWNVIKSLKECLYLLLQGVPKDIDSDQIKQLLLTIDQVNKVRHLHIWSMDGEHHILTACLEVATSSLDEQNRIRHTAHQRLNPYPFKEVTIELI